MESAGDQESEKTARVPNLVWRLSYYENRFLWKETLRKSSDTD